MVRHPKRTRLLIVHQLHQKMAGEPGFEPGLPGPEPGVLPLDYSPATPQKAAAIGQQLQSPLSYH